jgi:hypothetical protein
LVNPLGAANKKTDRVTKAKAECEAKGAPWKWTGTQCTQTKSIATARRKAECEAKGWRWETAGKCVKPSEVKADCESKGHTYDVDTGLCQKSLRPKEQAEEQTSTKEADSADSLDYGDDEPKKHKKKKRYYAD